MNPLLLALICVIILMGINIVIVGVLLYRSAHPKDDQAVDRVVEKERAFRQQEHQGLRQEFRDQNKTLHEQFFRSSQVISQLQKELGKMGHVATRIEHLDKLFRAPKARGSMGEESLEEILRSIFPPHLWERQYRLGEGIADAVVKTSSGLIPIDAKFPLPSFERLTQETGENQKSAEKAFHQDLKKRISEVEKYIRPDQETIHFAILFLPNESIYYEGCVRTDTIQPYAREKRVLLTGPSTLVYVLQTIFKAYQSQTFAQKAQEALSQLSHVTNQSQKLNQSLETLDKHLMHAQQKMHEVKGENQKLQLGIEKVQALGEG